MVKRPTEEKQRASERFINSVTTGIGSPTSIVLHTIFFVGCFALVLFGFAFDTILLLLTTVVSLEAIYLALFIQMSVNRTTESLENVEEDLAEIVEDVAEIEKDIDEIQEDVAEIEKDVDEIQEDVAEIEKDVDEIEKDDEEWKKRDETDSASLKKIEDKLASIIADLEKLRH